MKKIVVLIVVLLLLVGGLFYSLKVKIKEYSNDDFGLKYDTTWKVEKSRDSKGLYLRHRKSKAILNVQCKVLDWEYIDVGLMDIIDDIIYSIEEQNGRPSLISRLDITNQRYEAYSYLYEEDSRQTLVNVYKKDNKVIVAFYDVDSEYYDIVLDSVDMILDSLEIKTGVKVN